ncbi:amidohydrolase [Gimibacter soli]|uniref:Amidohydrolase n=1 Tax=Gimibacter soli TaxID=3024400 RepID=A0AAE9XP87_9PROT|nr:amidohydrolase [Gimibacter soli]WCL53692.1 amidohydrolase [Gimibacter soli]
MRKLTAWALAASVFTAPCMAADATPDGAVSYDHIAKMSRSIWDYAEVGYKETKSSKLLQDTLKKAGFKVEAGVADIPTAFEATYGSGGPVIAILAEFDALPGISQDASPERHILEEKKAGHACGHNLFGAGSVEAAISVAKWLKATGTPGTIRLYGTPAEEGGSGKVYMVRAGLFNDVDFVLHWHAGDRNMTSASSNLANKSAKFRFHGLSAHAAAAPEKGRSALDGIEAMNMMVNMMREHVPEESRIHYVITRGGSAPNVVPDFAEVYYYVRNPDAEVVKDIFDRVVSAANGAAMGTGTTVDYEIVGGTHALLINDTLAQVADEKMREVGGVTYDAEEQAFAKTLYATLKGADITIDSARDVLPYGTTRSSGSTDVGDVSMAVPTVGIRTATWVPGTPAHSWQAIAASGMSIGYKGATVAARTLAKVAAELYTNPELREKAKAEFEKQRGEDFKYEALLGDRPPALNYRD